MVVTMYFIWDCAPDYSNMVLLELWDSNYTRNNYRHCSVTVVTVIFTVVLLYLYNSNCSNYSAVFSGWVRYLT